MMSLLVAVAGVVVIAIAMSAVKKRREPAAVSADPRVAFGGRDADRPHALFVFAHPDDEAMFMTPTIRALVTARWDVSWLCLTDGGGGGSGEVRASELLASGKYFGVPPDRIEVVEDALLPDSMTATWPADRVARYISRAVERWRPTHLMTFDDFGVSGHTNHRATYAGVVAWATTTEPSHSVRVWKLHSQPILRKYSGPLVRCIPQWPLAPDGSVVVRPPWADVKCPLEAMRRHASQLVWFRYLFVWLSSSTYENVWAPL